MRLKHKEKDWIQADRKTILKWQIMDSAPGFDEDPFDEDPFDEDPPTRCHWKMVPPECTDMSYHVVLFRLIYLVILLNINN